MTTKFALLSRLGVMAALVACLTAPASANLITNPGFEASNSVLEDWVPFDFTSTTTVDATGTNAHSGNNAVVEVGGTATTGSTGLFQQLDNVIPGTTFTFTVWAKTDALPMSSDDTYGGAVIRLQFEDDTLGGQPDANDIGKAELALGPIDNFPAVSTGNGLLSTSYQQFTVVGVAPAETVQLKLQLYSRHNDRAIFFDDVDLTAVLPPNTPAFGVTIDRTTGNISLENVGTGTGTIKDIQITSASGALDPLNWKSVAGNYDTSGGTSNGSVDGNDAWTRQVETNFELREDETVGDGGVLTVGQVVDLGDDAWIKTATEDLEVEITFTDDSTFTSSVTFTGGPTGSSFQRSDLNFDGDIDATDWPLLRDNLFGTITTTSQAVAYQSGDLNGDFLANFGDFILFKNDFDAANGIGALDALIAGVPEPSSLALLAMGAIGISLSRKRRSPRLCKAAGLLVVALTAATISPSASFAATSVDLSTFTVDDYPLIEGSRFNFVTYTTTANSAVLDVSSNPHVFYGGTSILNKRITGTINPGADNDLVGLAFGYNAGDTSNPLVGGSGGADFILLDWKFDDSVQGFDDDFVSSGPPTFQDFHDTTSVDQQAKAGLALSRVSGTPTGEELWGHVNASGQFGGFDNPLGGVAELQRGAIRGTLGYVKNQDHVFDVTYTSTQIIVKIDGNEEINLSGSFPDGVLGLYSMDQNPLNGSPTYSNFEVSDLDEVLTATVNTLSGNITLSNASGTPIDLDGYTLTSASSSLDFAAWNSLQDQDLSGFAAGDGTGNGWEEGSNSGDATLVEGNFVTTSVFGSGASVSLGSAFDTSGSQDLVFSHVESATSLVTTGIVNYVSTVEDANFDGDSDVDGGDFLAWQRGFGLTGQTDNSNGDANGSGIVDGADLTAWQTQFGTTGLLSGAQAVPEPSSALLLILAAFGLGMSRSRS